MCKLRNCALVAFVVMAVGAASWALANPGGASEEFICPGSNEAFAGHSAKVAVKQPFGQTDEVPGFPVDLHLNNAGFPYTPTLYDIDGDGAAEIFVTGGYTFGLRGDGTFLPGWPTTEMYAMGYGTNGCMPGPSVADFDGDGTPDVLWMLRDWYYQSLHMWTFNGRKLDGTNLLNFPQAAPDGGGNALSSPFVLGDVNEDGHLQAWGFHSVDNNFDYKRISAYDHTGTRLFTRHLPDTESVAGLYFGDIDNDGHREMFALAWESPSFILHVFNPDGSDKPGYPFTVITFTQSGYLMNGAPVPADVDGDGQLDLIFGLYDTNLNSWLECRHVDGSNVAGFPLLVNTNSQLYTVGLGDVTGDGRPELIALDNNLAGGDRINVFDLTTLAPLPGFPVDLPIWIYAFPAVADIDGDGLQDILITSNEGLVYAVNGVGEILPEFPKAMTGSGISGAAVGDIDGDGLFEIVVSTWHGWVYAWDTPAPARAGLADRPSCGINAHNTGVCGDWQSTQLGDVTLGRATYNCQGTATIRVIDSGLNTSPTVRETTTVMIVSTTDPTGRSVTLTETWPDTGVFVGSVPLSVTGEPGTLQVAHGDAITATYVDANNGIGGYDVSVTAHAAVDCQPPVISDVKVTDIYGTNVVVTFATSEPARGQIHFGAACGTLDHFVGAAGAVTAHTIQLIGLMPEQTYYFAVEAEDVGGNVVLDNNGGACYSFTTPPAPNYFTELFTAPPDVAYRTFRFRPDSSLSRYAACTAPIAALPTDPAGGNELVLADDDSVEIPLTTPALLYGISYSSVFVGSNGYITLGMSDTQWTESLEAHFSMPRISALFEDLNPTQYGAVSWKELTDRVVVTWDNVPQWGDPEGNTFQIELWHDGTVTVSYLAVASTHALAGLSAGNGMPLDFVMSDLTGLPPCLCAGDSDCDGRVNFSDIDLFVAAIPDNEAAWAALYAARHGGEAPPCPYLNSDCNGDGHVNFADIDPFVALIPSVCP